MMAEKKRNPPWTRDEIILALDLYRQVEGAWPRESDPRVAALSDTLNSFWRAQGHEGATLRNANGVKMKLMNLRAHDPAYADKAGLKAGNHIEREVWADFADDPRHLKETADAIREAIVSGKAIQIEVESDEILDPNEVEAPEGRLLTVMHHRRERSRKIVKAKKQDVLKKVGRLTCEACSFDFAERYGARGDGFIECHHIKPLADLAEAGNTRLADLALLCANCHRMIHAKRPWLSVDELRALLDLEGWN
ncbi:HNH endonuclease [Gluconobacter morbifer]|uniref:HNH endonuclease n=1 Tax=Gluconobacter morbifer TaxID=479935 RepID=UPI00058F2D87|nr:HNH endonuclease [Gluconobacter morbifer]